MNGRLAEMLRYAQHNELVRRAEAERAWRKRAASMPPVERVEPAPVIARDESTAPQRPTQQAKEWR